VPRGGIEPPTVLDGVQRVGFKGGAVLSLPPMVRTLQRGLKRARKLRRSGPRGAGRGSFLTPSHAGRVQFGQFVDCVVALAPVLLSVVVLVCVLHGGATMTGCGATTTGCRPVTAPLRPSRLRRRQPRRLDRPPPHRPPLLQPRPSRRRLRQRGRTRAKIPASVRFLSMSIS
jgi:hypothetical protein